MYFDHIFSSPQLLPGSSQPPYPPDFTLILSGNMPTDTSRKGHSISSGTPDLMTLTMSMPTGFYVVLQFVLFG